MLKNEKKFYLCDPKKNKECAKSHCQEYCICTENKKFRAGLWAYVKSYVKGFRCPPC